MIKYLLVSKARVLAMIAITRPVKEEVQTVP